MKKEKIIIVQVHSFASKKSKEGWPKGKPAGMRPNNTLYSKYFTKDGKRKKSDEVHRMQGGVQ